MRARHVLVEVARRAPDAGIVALVHSARLAEAQAVADELGLASRIEFLSGDPAGLDFGLRGSAYRDLAARTRVVHAAYSILDPDADANTTEAVNVGAARELVELARAEGPLERVVLYSSLFVSGDRRGPVREDELEAGQTFRNSSERSLAIAERMLRKSGAPVTVLRAGHLLGDSMARVDRPSAPYVCIGLLASSPADLPLPLPPFAEAPLPLSPVAYLASIGASALTLLPPGRTVHAIDPEPLTLGGFVAMLAERLGRGLDTGFNPGAMTRVLLGNPAARLLPKSRRSLLEALTTGGDYAIDTAAELAAQGGPRCPPLSGYLDRVIEQARDPAAWAASEARDRDEPPFLVA